jgi:hypothetical protein
MLEILAKLRTLGSRTKEIPCALRYVENRGGEQSAHPSHTEAVWDRREPVLVPVPTVTQQRSL